MIVQGRRRRLRPWKRRRSAAIDAALRVPVPEVVADRGTPVEILDRLQLAAPEAVRPPGQRRVDARTQPADDVLDDLARHLPDLLAHRRVGRALEGDQRLEQVLAGLQCVEHRGIGQQLAHAESVDRVRLHRLADRLREQVAQLAEPAERRQLSGIERTRAAHRLLAAPEAAPLHLAGVEIVERAVGAPLRVAHSVRGQRAFGVAPER